MTTKDEQMLRDKQQLCKNAGKHIDDILYYETKIKKLEAEIKELEEGATQQSEVYESEIANLEAENKKLKEENEMIERKNNNIMRDWMEGQNSLKKRNLTLQENIYLLNDKIKYLERNIVELEKDKKRNWSKLLRSIDAKNFMQAKLRKEKKKLATLKERVEKLKTYSIKVGKKPFEPHVETKYYYGKAISLKSIIKLIEEMK